MQHSLVTTPILAATLFMRPFLARSPAAVSGKLLLAHPLPPLSH